MQENDKSDKKEGRKEQPRKKIKKTTTKPENGEELTCGETCISPYNLLCMTCIYTE